MTRKERLAAAGDVFLEAKYGGATHSEAFSRGLAVYNRTGTEKAAEPRWVPDWANEIGRRVAAQHGIDFHAMRSKTRWRVYSLPREKWIWLLRQTEMPFPTIGAAVNRDHTSVMHSYRQFETKMERDPALAAEMAQYRKVPADAAFPGRRRQEERRLVAV
jgi:hypothetical protein